MSLSSLQLRFRFVAMIAAYALVLQALFAGPLMGAAADPLRLESAGAILCGAAADPAGQDRQAPGHLPDCCITGCLAVATATLAGTGQPLLFPPSRFEPLAIPRPAVHRTVDRKSAPGKPRAPPHFT